MKTASLLATLTSAVLATSASAQVMDFAKVEIITEKLAPNVYMLSGSAGLDPSHEDAAGGRIGVLAGPDGVLKTADLKDIIAEIHRIAPPHFARRAAWLAENAGGTMQWTKEA